MDIRQHYCGQAVFAVICGAVLVAFTCSSVGALELSKPKGIIYGSLGLPSRPDTFDDAATLGFGGGIGLGIFLVPHAMLQLSAEYTTFGADGNGLRKVYSQAPDVGVVGGEISVLYTAASLRLSVVRLPGIHAYVVGGAGFFRYVPDKVQFDNVVLERKTENTAGFHGGVGLDIPVGSLIDIFADAAYVMGATEGGRTAYIPLRLGLIFELTAE